MENKECNCSEKVNLAEIAAKDQVNLRKFLIDKYWFEIGTLIIMLTTIFLCCYFRFIDMCTAGTLLGSIVGFFAGSIRKIHE